MKPIIAAIALAALLGAAANAAPAMRSTIPNAKSFEATGTASIRRASYGPGVHKVPQSRPGTKTAQACFICQVGAFWCTMGAPGFPGGPCVCPGVMGVGFIHC